MIKTSKLEIANYWNSVKSEDKFSVSQCWRCGIKKRLDRCHIKAQAISGADEPSNFVLLCKHCHFDSPNTDNSDFIWEWLDHYRMRPEADLWFHLGVREYNSLYQENLYELIKGNETTFENVFHEKIKKATRHFGQPSINPASVAGIIREVIKYLELD